MSNYTVIFKIELGNENHINQDAIFSFGIASPKTAILLNYLIYSKICECPPSRTRYNELRGGGLFVKGEAKVFTNELGEVGIYFGNMWNVNNYCRVARGKTEKLIAIKNKIADYLKYIFVTHSRDNNLYISLEKFSKLSTSTYNEMHYLQTNNLDIFEEDGEKYITISKEEYRCLYEFLKNRNKEKTIRKYGEVAYNSVIGKVIEDQFVISAMDVIKTEMTKAEAEYQEAYNIASNEYQKEMDIIRQNFKDKQAELEKIRQEKISALKNQLNEIKTMAGNL